MSARPRKPRGLSGRRDAPASAVARAGRAAPVVLLAVALALSALAVSPFRHLGELTLPKRTLLQVATAVCVLWIALDGGRRRRCIGGLARSRAGWLLAAGAALLAWTGASLAWAPSTFEGWPLWWHWLVCGVLVLATATLCETPEARGKIASALVLGAAGVALVGIAQFLFGLEVVPQRAPPSSTFGNRNFAAQAVVLALPLTVVGFGTARSPAIWIGALVSFVAIGAYLLFVRSTAAWIVVLLALAGVIVPLAHSRVRSGVGFDRRRGAAAAVGLAALALLGGLESHDPSLEHRTALGELIGFGSEMQAFSEGGAERVGRSSTRARLNLLYNTWPMIRDHPVAGVGTGGWRIHYPRYAHSVVPDAYLLPQRIPLRAHNDHLQLVAESGLVGGGLLLLAFVAGVAVSRRALASAEPGAERGLAWAALISVAGLGVNAAFSFPLRNLVPPAWAAASLGLVLSFLLPRSTEAERADEPAWLAPAFAGGAALFLGMVVWLAFDAWRYDLAVSRVITAAKSGLHREALRLGGPLLERDPDDRILLYYLGRTHLRRKSAGGLPYFERIRAFDPWSPGNLMDLARSHHHGGDRAQAIRHAEQALAIAPACFECVRFLAARLREGGDWDRAVEVWESFLPHAVDRERARRRLYETLQAHPEIERAEALLSRHIEAHPDDPYAHEQMALLRLRTNDVQGAATSYEKALERIDDPEHADLFRKNLETLRELR